jgi:subtilisin family serine protease
MFSKWSSSLILSATLLIPLAGARGQTPHPPAPHVEGELLVSPRQGVSDSELEATYVGHGGKKIRTLSQIKVHQISVPAQALESIETALQKNPKVAFVEKNLIGEAQLVPNDPGYSSQWHLPQISAPQGWDISIGSTSVPIAVIDSGVDPTHPDLLQVKGYNFLYGSDPADTHDVLGHGTSVAGAAAALGNSGIGIAGVAWTNPIMPLVTVTSSNTGTVADTSSAIVYAADHGARVINISLGWTGYTSTMESAVNYAWNKGLVIVASAGNYGNNSPIYPAALNNVVSVSATDSADNLASWSTYGPTIDVAAPGVSIYTTANGGGYRSASGTSFSAPIVSGLAALIFSVNPNFTNAQVVDLIRNNTDDKGSVGFDDYYGYGRVNVYRSLLIALSTTPATTTTTTPPPTTTPPSDTTPPVVEGISMQYDGKWLTVNVSASDAQSGVAKVELYANGKLQATDSSKPYTFKLNTKPWAKGSYQIQATAYDAAGNSSSSVPATLTIQ